MHLKQTITIGFIFLLSSILLNAQPNENCKQGTEKSDYGFVNPCTSFISWDVTPKQIGSVFEFDFETLSKNSFCVYSFPPSDKAFFDGKIEFVENIQFGIKGRENLVVNLTPCKLHRFYVKDNFEYRFTSWERELGTYSNANWRIEHQNKTPTKIDSIFYLNARKPSFGEYMALLYLELDSEVDFDVPKIAQYLTRDEKHMRTFYEDYIGKSYDNLNQSFSGEEEQIEFTPNLIAEEYARRKGSRDYFLSISLFFDTYYKEYEKYMPSKNPEELISQVYNFLNPPSRSYSYAFNPQTLIDKYYGSVHFGFRNENLALEIANPHIKDVFNQPKTLSFLVRADFTYQNLPYERIQLKNEKEIHLDSFSIGNGFLHIQPIRYSLDLDLHQNEEYEFGYISSFHQQYERDFPPRIHSDEYIQSFMGLYIKEATVSLKLKGETYTFEYAKLLVDGSEINGTINIDFSKFKTPLDGAELIEFFHSNGIEAEIPDMYSNAQTAHVFFRIK